MAKPNDTVSLTTDGRLFGGWPASDATRIADLDATAATNHLAGLWSVSKGVGDEQYNQASKNPFVHRRYSFKEFTLLQK